MRRNRDELIADCRGAVLAEVVETGIGRLSIEGVARRAGVAKTSIYRHWPTAEDLLLDALSEAYPVELPSPAGGDLRADLLRSLDLLTGWLSSVAAQVVAAIMTERRRRPDLTDALYTRVFDPHGGRFTRAVMEHYAELGEIDARLVTPVVCDIGEALVIKHQIDTGELPDHTVLAAIVDQAILPALKFTPSKRSTP